MTTAILTGLEYRPENPGWIDALFTFLYTLRAETSFPFSLFIYQKGLSPENIRRLKAWFGAQVLDYTGPAVQVDNKDHTSFIFCKFHAFDYLLKFDQVIWMDADTIALKPATGIFNLNRGLWARLEALTCDRLFARDPLFLEPCYYQEFRARKMFNAGVLVLNRDLLDAMTWSAREWCLEMVYKNYSNMIYMDQAIWNLWAYCHDVTVNDLPAKFNNVCEPPAPDQVLYHLADHPKPWASPSALWFRANEKFRREHGERTVQ